MSRQITILICLCLALVPLVSADELTPYPVYNEIRQIQNGGCVEINATVDISSLGWGVQRLDYYNRWTDVFSTGSAPPAYSIPIPYSAKALKTFWLDPSIFGTRTGYWYQGYLGNGTEPAGNLRMFRVNATCPVKPIQEPINVTVNTIDKTVPDPLPYLPAKKEGNVLLARGDEISVNAGSPVRWWLFGPGPDDIVRDRDVSNPKGTLTITEEDMHGLSTGDYRMLMIRAGDNQIYEEYYNPAYTPYRMADRTYPVIESPFRSVEPVDIEGRQPGQVRDLLVKSVASSIDDSATEWTLHYQEPEIQVKQVNAIESEQTNSTWYNIRGYTNLAAGTVLTVTIDKYNLNEITRNIRETQATVIGSSNAGEWRQFNALIQVDYKNIFPGMHDVTVAAGDRTSQTVQVYIYKELPAHYVPPQYIEYTGVSPYVTPQIIEKIVTIEVPGPERVREVHIAPTAEELQAAREKADWEIVRTIAGALALLGAILGIGWWIRSAYRRAATA
jgi:hypothetical protein